MQISLQFESETQSYIIPCAILSVYSTKKNKQIQMLLLNVLF